ncbi:hypothetical protein BHF71_09005 [Vulcanibacillus modesticaldus]|uniref:Uncharacterized protein n=1 Tax=Vulcanibacillus modesticaldus TaxID=337097 RepID=A0A1D2YUR8_9BACI|nr:hypothetical protein [Vulcanibacillus modesticaldus]OEF99439.1 hypothetical protein BHF71_09005 [Vulcanibacillus modesticaldus]
MLKIARQNSKFRAIYLPILITIILIGILLYRNIQSELTLPDTNWSRDVTLPMTTMNALPFVREDANGVHIYGKEGRRVKHLVLKDGLRVKMESSIEIDLPPLKPFWAKNERLVYIKDGELFLFSEGIEKSLYQNVNGMVAKEDLVIFWQDTNLFKLDAQDFSVIPIGSTNDRIDSVIINQDSPANFIVITKSDMNRIQLTFYRLKDNNTYNQISLLTMTEYPGEKITGFQFVSNEKEIDIIYTTYSVKQGVVTYRAYFTKAMLNNLSDIPPFTNIEVIDEQYMVKLKNPKHIQLSLEDDVPTILLAVNGYLTPKKRAVNIYEAKNIDGKWVANKRSKTARMSVRPFWLDYGNILWLDFISTKEYQLKGSSTNPITIEESQRINYNDWMNALANTLLSLTASLVIILNSILWMVPTAFFITVISFIDITLLERDVKWIKKTAIILYLTTQLFVVKGIFSATFNVFAPSFLAFRGNSFIIPLGLAVVTYMITKYAKNDDWEPIHEISYFMLVNVWLFTILIGPYTI